MGISLGRTNYCIKALIEKGALKATNFRNNKKKLAYMYLLTPEGVELKAGITMQYLKLKLREYEALQAEIKEYAGKRR